jgi:PII-like signaling protein
VNGDCLKLTSYFGERDRTRDAFVADALLDLFGREGLATSVLLRGTEGFGEKHVLQTQRLLSLSEDLPVVAVAVDLRARIEALVPEVRSLVGEGLVTLERARMATGKLEPVDVSGPAKLTVYCGRREPVYELVSLLQRHGVAGATALLGVDGTARGERRRARFFGRNADVPLMVISVGDGDRLGAVLPEIERLLRDPIVTLERITVCRRDGVAVDEPRVPGPAVWQKLMVYTSEQARHGRHPLHLALIRRLREEGAIGATALRGFWGYHGDHAPHGDRLLSLRRHVPVVTVVVDRPDRARRWLDVVSDYTSHTGLVTSEMVPVAL